MKTYGGLVGSVVIAFTLAVQPASAALPKHRQQPPPPQSSLVEIGGRVLEEQDADALRHPASLTKVLTLLMLFEALDRKELTLDTELTMSETASATWRPKLDLKIGQRIKVRDAIKALIVLSDNRTAAMVGERLGGAESAFAKKMTERAHELGMNSTIFRNASGLPDPEQVTTARDMAILATYVFTRYQSTYYPYFSLREFSLNGKKYPGHNHFLDMYPGADGIKTGYIDSSGSNLVASAKLPDGERVISVVFGRYSGRDAAAWACRLIEDARRNLLGPVVASSGDITKTARHDRHPKRYHDHNKKA